MLISYNADLLPKVRMLGQIRYNEPWLHFSRCINEWVLYVIRDGNLYLQEDGIRYHLSAGDFFLLEPGLPHEGYAFCSVPLQGIKKITDRVVTVFIGNNRNCVYDFLLYGQSIVFFKI